jgi:hypothetical protein
LDGTAAATILEPSFWRSEAERSMSISVAEMAQIVRRREHHCDNRTNTVTRNHTVTPRGRIGEKHNRTSAVERLLPYLDPSVPSAGGFFLLSLCVNALAMAFDYFGSR